MTPTKPRSDFRSGELWCFIDRRVKSCSIGCVSTNWLNFRIYRRAFALKIRIEVLPLKLPFKWYINVSKCIYMRLDTYSVGAEDALASDQIRSISDRAYPS